MEVHFATTLNNTEWFKAERLNVLQCPSYSPNLNQDCVSGEILNIAVYQIRA